MTQDLNQKKYDELAYYTLAHPDHEYFIHQYLVDAYAAQYADEQTKPIKIAFALAGLYLHHVKNYSGKDVQLAHMLLGRKKKPLPVFKLPLNRGLMTIDDVLMAPPGQERDKAINEWSVSVWQAWSESHDKVAKWLKEENIISK